MKLYTLLVVFLVAGFVCSESIATQRLGLFGRLRQRRSLVQVRAPFVDVRVGGGVCRRDLDVLRLQRLQQLRRSQQFELRIPVQVDSFGGCSGGQCNGFYR